MAEIRESDNIGLAEPSFTGCVASILLLTSSSLGFTVWNVRISSVDLMFFEDYCEDKMRI